MQCIIRFKQLAFLAILISAAHIAHAGASGQASRNVAGVYTLEGVREMAATLVSHPNNRFEYGAVYGGADPRANGKWSVKDNIVHLIADQRPAKYTKVEQGTEPLPDTADSDGTRIALAVEIPSPSLRMKWSGLKVEFKFANGRTRNGTTSRSGMVYAGARQEPEWKDVPITEIGLPSLEGDEKIIWIKLKDRTITKVTIELDPGAMTQAFREDYLEVEEGRPHRLVAGRLMGELRGTYVWNRPAKSSASPQK